MSSSKLTTAERIVGQDKNLWVEYSALATETKAVNLGQGFPDFSPPQFVIDALVESTKTAKLHQYTRGPGHPRLVNAIAKLYSKLLGRTINPMTQVTTTIGAYSALYQCIQGHVNPDDELIVIEPFFDCYKPMTLIASGKLVYVPLRPSPNADTGNGRYPVSSKDWVLDPEELAQAFSPKTKAIIVNNPNNPIGKVFTRSELEIIADLCKKHDVLCISDEVYEWLIYPGAEHVRIASLPGMWERTVTIGSAGKTFSCTGWKLGWGIGPDNLIKNMMTVGTNVNYTNPTTLQEAVAVGFEVEIERLGKPDSYFKELPALLLKKRDKMIEELRKVGFLPVVPQGGYYIMADTGGLDIKFNEPSEEPYDCRFVKWMMKEKGVATIPPSYFFCPDHQYVCDKMIRFCFCKEESTLDAAYQQLQKWLQERN